MEAGPFRLELDGVMLKSSLRQDVDFNEKLRPNETRNQECCHGWANPGHRLSRVSFKSGRSLRRIT
jgi:hypothetical protein